MMEPPAHHEKGPCFVLYHTNEESDETLASLFDFRGKHICCIPQLQNKTVMASCHGWLLLISNEDPRNFSMWNSVSYETINLPPLKYSEPDQYNCVLTSVPTDPKGLVILCDILNPRLIFCKPRSKKWSVQNITQELQYEDVHGNVTTATLYNPVSIHGIVYACSHESFRSDNRLFAITVISSNKLRVKRLETIFPTHPWPTIRYGEYLMECCGELLMIMKVYRLKNLKEISHMQLFIMDFSTMKWVKMETLKDQALFLGDNYSVSCCVSDYPEIEGNCIYFTNLYSRILYSFNIEYGFFSLSSSFQNTRKLLSSNWIIPDIRLADKVVEESGGRGEAEKIEKIEKEGLELKVAEEKNLTEIPCDILDLSLDILELIGKSLILFDYLYFRATCLKFREAAPPISWRSTYINIASEKDVLSPWFMFFKNDREACDIIVLNPNHNDLYFINFPEFLLSARIHFSNNGWLLMSTANDSFHFFNPCTKVIHSLPKMNPTTAPTHIGFSSSPTSPNCLVVGITELPETTLLCFIRLGEKEWGEWGEGMYEDDIFEPSNNTLAFYDKRFWFLDENGKLAFLREGDQDSNEFFWEVLNQLQTPCTSFESNYIVECDGELISVFVGELGRWVKVFKLDYSAMVWLEVKSLEKNMIFVSHSSCFSAVAKFTGMENKIYFPRLCGQDIIFYSLETKKLHSFTDEESMEDFQVSNLPLYCSWIEPKWG